MKLTVNKQLIHMPVDASISIERTSPVLNEKTGTFSYPFPAPTLPNEKALGYPGRLQRVGYLSSKDFVLEDGGLQILRGQIDFDSITHSETGLILLSGQTEFYAKIEGKKLPSLDFGTMPFWGWATSKTEIQSYLDAWDLENTQNTSHRVFAPVHLTGSSSDILEVNRHNTSTDKLILTEDAPGTLYKGGDQFMMQLRVWWIIQTIFESQGYTVVQNDLQTTVLKKLILFTNPFYSVYTGNDTSLTVVSGISGGFTGTVEYAHFMPENVSLTDFLKAVRSLTCCMYDIDERSKVVRIVLRKDIFLPANLLTNSLRELNNWEHTEERAKDGFALRYDSQDDELDTREDYAIHETVQTNLPTPNFDEEVVHVTDYNRDYIALRNDLDVLEWHRIGRLKGYIVDGGEEETTIGVKIPVQISIDGAEGAQIKSSLTQIWPIDTPVKINELYFSLYHGRHDFNGFNCPYTCPEKYSLATSGLPYSVVTNSTSLDPEALHDLVYADFLSWSAEKRIMTKYLRLSLRDVINLRWDQRYVVNGIPILLNKINFELPHKGICKIEAYTAPAREEEIDFGPLPPNLIM